MDLLADQIEAANSGIEGAHELDASEAGETASARARVKFGRPDEQTYEFPLVKENGVWKLDSIEPIRQ